MKSSNNSKNNKYSSLKNRFKLIVDNIETLMYIIALILYLLVATAILIFFVLYFFNIIEIENLINISMETFIEIFNNYIIPISIACFIGKKIYDTRGIIFTILISVITIVAGQNPIFIAITGVKTPMILATIIFGSLSVLTLKYTEKFLMIKFASKKIIINFYFIFLAAILSFVVFYMSIYFIGYIQIWLKTIVEIMIKNKLYSWIAIFVETAKILFLINIIRHDVFIPLGTEEVKTSNQSILFILDSNPGPGLGILLTLTILFYLKYKNASKNKNKTKNKKLNKKLNDQKESAKLNGVLTLMYFMIGIEQIYSIYLLFKPFLIIAAIIGGIFGNIILELLNVGIKNFISFKSIFILYEEINKTTTNNIIGLILAIIISAIISGLLTWLILFLSDTFKKNINKNNKTNYQNVNKISKFKKSNSYSIIFVYNRLLNFLLLKIKTFNQLLKFNNSIKKLWLIRSLDQKWPIKKYYHNFKL
ncbi:hypothetical protein [[Mycoplasma] cavipharyngis]|uniref:hypothetical protein n=1 Tax=[Mycoplasma] cavipharyngis TaxID=92757 RepID=UPI003703DCCA